MIVYLLTDEQANQLNGYEKDDNLFMLTKDGNGKYFITKSQVEYLKTDFSWVTNLPTTEYVPPINKLP